MRPSYQPKVLRDETSSMRKIPMTTPKGVSCPRGTVPIRRTRKEDLIRARNFSGSYANHLSPRATEFPGQHFAIMTPSNPHNSTYRGVKANINIYSLDVKAGQASFAQMGVEGGPRQQHTTIRAGSMVAPDLMGDDRAHLTIYWKTNNSKTGCYNQLCPGFVQVDPHVRPGNYLSPTSVYDGAQYLIDIVIFQDIVTGNWWFQYYGHTPVGYWPKELFPQLEHGASAVSWGGWAIGPPNGESPPMGSGHFPDGSYKRACLISEIYIIDASYDTVIPDDHAMLQFVDNPKCYNVQYLGLNHGLGLSFLFGGPGGMCGV